MQKSLLYRYFVFFASCVFFAFLFLGLVLFVLSSKFFAGQQFELLRNNLNSAATITMSEYNRNDYKYIDRNMIINSYTILSSGINADFFLVDANTRKTILCTESETCVHTPFLINESIIESASKGNFSEVGNLGGIYKDTKYTVCIPLYNPDHTIAGLLFASSSTERLQSYLFQMAKIFSFAAGIVMLVSFIAIYYLTRQMTKPLREMSLAAKSFSMGDFSRRVQEDRQDEIGHLAQSFNQMATALSQLEKTRSSFVANVSHELRTPMTSIVGFVDGILDGTIPKEQSKQYLTIVSGEIKRLSRLTSSMLNISKIEAGETKIVPVTFNMMELIYTILFSFEKQIELKGLDIRVQNGDSRIIVRADRDLIYQAAYNLIENAVKFSNEKGYIEIDVKNEHGQIVVKIKNSGLGIAQTDLSHIFERFYKTDKSRGLDKNGVGLGLYIVKSIINLHGGDIIVRSVEGEYCEFVFNLPLPKHEYNN